MTTDKQAILYPYARINGGDAVHISMLSEVHTELSCLACGEEMIAKRGEIVRHHFAHKGDVCPQGETALHWAAKYTIRDGFNWAVESGQPYIVEWACNDGPSGRHVRGVNLPLFYNRAVVEGEPFLGVRADVLLLADDGYILGVEVVVTNAVTQEKAAFYEAAGVPYIMISLQKDADIELLLDRITKPYDIAVSKWGWVECDVCAKDEAEVERKKQADKEAIEAQNQRIAALRIQAAKITDAEEEFHASLSLYERKEYRESITVRWQQAKSETTLEREYDYYGNVQLTRAERRAADVAKWNDVIKKHEENGEYERADAVRYIMKNVLFLADD